MRWVVATHVAATVVPVNARPVTASIGAMLRADTACWARMLWPPSVDTLRKYTRSRPKGFQSETAGSTLPSRQELRRPGNASHTADGASSRSLP